MEYHKIQSLYLRDPITKHKTFLEGQYSLPEFEYLKDTLWVATEKIDGTNVRVYWDAETKKVSFNGRTKDAQMPTALFQKLTEMFPAERFPFEHSLTLYGEGYGAKIQKGGGDYIPDGCSFILFDVFCGCWLERSSVEDIAKTLGIEAVPVFGTAYLRDFVDLCKRGFKSALKTSEPEGFVIRPQVELLRRNGSRIITKLKLKDFPAAAFAEKGANQDDK